MPRKPKYIPKDFSKELALAQKQKKKNELKVVPFFVGVPCQYKFCFAGDVMINMQWLQEKPLNEVEVYDKPFKGFTGSILKRDLKILEAEFYSFSYQMTDVAEEIAKKAENFSSSTAREFSQMICFIENKSKEQAVYLDNQQPKVSEYKIDSQNQKRFNGANLDLLNVIGTNLNQPNSAISRKTSFIDNYLGLGFLVNPFDSRDVTQEFLLHTLDGVALKDCFIKGGLDQDSYFYYTPNYNLDLFYAHLSNQDKEILPKGVVKGIPLKLDQRGYDKNMRYQPNQNQSYDKQEANTENTVEKDKNTSNLSQPVAFEVQKKAKEINEIKFEEQDDQIDNYQENKKITNHNSQAIFGQTKLGGNIQLENSQIENFLGKKTILPFDKTSDEEISNGNKKTHLFDNAIKINEQNQNKITQKFIQKYYQK